MEKKLALLTNEEIISESPGFCKDNLRSGWKPGHLYLTNTRLLLWQPARIIFQTSLENIKGISIQQRGFILRNKDALCISYKNQSGEGVAQAWIMVKDVERWKNKIFERSLLEINQEAIDKVIKELDPQSRNILLFVWQNRHATIDELAHLYKAPSHMDVLHRIRNIINPTSQKLIGFPVLVFERSKIDGLTGTHVMFSWWIIGDDKLSARGESVFTGEGDKEQSLLDVFDEGDHLNVIMELKGALEEDILLAVVEDKLTVSCKTPEVNYYEEVSFPSSVDSEGIVKKFRNNVLQVRLQKLIPKEVKC